MNFKSLLLGSTLLLSSIFGVVNPAEAAMGCGNNSVAITSDRPGDDSYVQFRNGGQAVFYMNGEKDYGTWYWSGNDIISLIGNHPGHWRGLRGPTASCDFRY